MRRLGGEIGRDIVDAQAHAKPPCLM